jgi:CO dehydrogenase/acetyl-CoA synthase alpha subunit
METTEKYKIVNGFTERGYLAVLPGAQALHCEH